MNFDLSVACQKLFQEKKFAHLLQTIFQVLTIIIHHVSNIALIKCVDKGDFSSIPACPNCLDSSKLDFYS